MNKQIFIISIALVLIFVGLSGCDENTKHDIIKDNLLGEWIMLYDDKPSNTSLIFYGNGSMRSIAPDIGLSTPGKWELKDDKIIFHAENVGLYDTWEYNYYFSNNNNTFTTILVGTNHTVVYVRALNI